MGVIWPFGVLFRSSRTFHGAQKGPFGQIQSSFWGPIKGFRGPKRGPIRHNDLNSVELFWLDNFIIYCTNCITFISTRARMWLMAPNLFCKGSIFSCMFFCSGHRHVGCPDRRNGMPWSFYAIKAHTEPSSWRKRPKTSFWDPSEAKHALLEVPGNAQMVWKQAKMYHISRGNPDKNLEEF